MNNLVNTPPEVDGLVADKDATETSSGIQWRHDILLVTIMAVLAGCGIIYEYLLAHYASRVMGATESTIFAMIIIAWYWLYYIRCAFFKYSNL